MFQYEREVVCIFYDIKAVLRRLRQTANHGMKFAFCKVFDFSSFAWLLVTDIELLKSQNKRLFMPFDRQQNPS